MLSEEKLSKIIGDIADNYEQEDLFTIESGHQLPNRDAVIHIIMGLRQIMFPGYFDKEHLERTIPEYFLGHNIILSFRVSCLSMRTVIPVLISTRVQ